MKPSVEISIDLTTQELLDPPPLDPMIEVHDIEAIDPSLGTDSPVANAPAPAPQTDATITDQPIEIELSAEQIDALLGAKAMS